MYPQRHHHWTRDKRRTTNEWFWAVDESGQFEALVYRNGRAVLDIPHLASDGTITQLSADVPDLHVLSHKIVALRRMATRFFKAHDEGREW